MKKMLQITKEGKTLVFLLLMAFFSPLTTNAQETVDVTIGEGMETGNYNYYPVHTYRNYSLTEQLYTADEIGTAGTINSIGFYYVYSEPFSMNNVTLYMKNVTRNTFANDTDMEPLSDSDIVWTGTFSASGSGWITITLDTPFNYDGDNLLVACFDGTNGKPGYSYNFRTFYTGTGIVQGIYWCSDTKCPDPYNTGSGFDGEKAPTSNRNTIQLNITPSPTPKPMSLTASNIAARVATLSWMNSNQNVLNYQYQYKAGEGEWTALETTTATSVNLTGLEMTTTYTFRVKAHYAADDSDFATTTFTTNSSCEQPTNFTANAVGDLTYATLTWKENGDANSWVLQYATDYYFSDDLIEIEVTTGFVVDGTTVSYTLTGLSEQKYFARVKPACDTEGTLWSDIIDFTPSFTNLAVGGTSTTSNTVPIYGYYMGGTVYSQFILPAESLDALAGGMLKRFTFHHNSWTFNLNGAQFEVYVAELDNATFSSNQFVDWTTLTQVFSGSLSTEANKMIVTLDNEFMYQGGNLLIGFKQTVSGNGSSVSWYGSNGEGYGNRCLFSYNDSNVGGSSFMPKTTFGYIPTAYPRVAAIEEGTITSTSATLSWVAPSNNVTGYVYQVKRLSDAEWPAQWTSLNATTVTLDNLNPITEYRFRVKALYGANESVPRTVSFKTECTEFADVPFTENFDSYSGNINNGMPDCWSYISSNSQFPKIYSDSYYAHSGTNSLQIWKYSSDPDQYAILPQVQNVNGLRVRFYAKGGNDNSKIIVGVMTDPADASTFQEIETIDLTTEYQKYKVSLNTYTGQNGYIAIKTGTSPCYVYIDDVTVEPLPSCEEPEGLEAGDVAAHAATFSWTDSGNPSAWQIYVSTDNVMPAEPNTANLHNVNSNPATVSGLAPETEYHAWVRCSCSTSGEYSPWSDPVSFTTGIACPEEIYTYFEDSDIAATYATIRWYSDGEETAWQICVNGDETNFIDVTTTTYTLTNLTAETDYTVKVRANCGVVDGYSSWSEEIEFTTDLCDPEYKCNISFSSTTDYYLEGEVVFMSGEEEVTTLQLNEGLGEVALCPGEYSIVWRGYGNGTFAIYGSDGNEIYSTDQAEDLGWDEVLVSSYNHVCEGVCFPPRNLDVLATTTTATFTWEPVGEETEWKVQYDALYTTNTIDFDGMTELPDNWDIYTDVEEDNVELDLDNACLHLTSVSSATINIPVYLGGISSFDVKAVGEATTVSYAISSSEYYYEDQEEIGTSEYQTITVPSQGYSGSGWLVIWINGGEVYIDNVQVMDRNGNYANAEATVQGTPSFVIEGLAPGTDYKARVKAVCDQDDESGWKETTFPTPLCDDACRIRYFLGDAASDGWNGAYISVLNSSATQVARLTFDDGDELSGYLSLCPDEIYSFIWISGGYDNECFFTIYGSDWTTVIATHEEASDFPADGVLCGSYEHHCAPCEIFEVSYGHPYEEDFNNTCWNTWTTIEGEAGHGHGDYGYPRLWQVDNGVIHVVPGRYTSSYFCLPPVKVTATTQFTFRTWIDTWPDMFTGDSYVIVSTDNGRTWNQISRAFEGGTAFWLNEEVRRTMRTRTISLGDYADYPSILVGFRYQGFYDQNGGGISTMSVDQIRVYDPNVFTDGAKNASWSNAGNWTQGVPSEGDDVLINGDCDLDTDAEVTSAVVGSGKTLTIQSDKTLTSDLVSTTDVSQLVIKDGAQLKHNNVGTLATVEKGINKYTVAHTGGGNLANGWYFIASPLNNAFTPTETMISNTYDLYRLDDTSWQNFKATDADHHPDFTALVNGCGYLYANSNDVTLQFTGELKPYSEAEGANEVPVSTGFNLVGNPFACNAYISQNYYTLNTDRNAILAYLTENSTALAPCTGVIVEATDNQEYVTFTKVAPSQSHGNNNGSLQITLSQATANERGTSTGSVTTLDNAIVSFNEGCRLGKFYFGTQNANIYLPQDGKEFAIASAEKQGEMPLNFKAKEDGKYTITVNAENVEVAYLHLIDNMTGADVDVLASPNYTFTAKATDYESRFKLVFVTNEENGPSTGSETFAFVDASGNIVINGEGIVQVIDMMGRVVVSCGGHTRCVSTAGIPAGMYVLRLIDGDAIRTQKMVID